MFMLVAAAAVMFSTTPADEMPMMSATMKVAACERFTTEAVPMLDITNWDVKDRELAAYAIEKGHDLAPNMSARSCASLMTKTGADIKATVKKLRK